MTARRSKVFAIAAMVAIFAFFHFEEDSAKAELIFDSSSIRQDNCAACHKTETAETVALYLSSVHAAKGFACNRCHGGESAAADKAKAHAGNFIGQPSPNEVLTMCGSCHRAQAASFKTGKHFPERRGQTRLDCSQCHGAHAVGSASRNFSFAYYCAGCHGQEYLPELPDNFKQMLALADSLNDAGRALSEDADRRRKEINRLIGEIVHPTDFEGARSRIPEILKLGDEFKRMIEKK